MKSIVILLLLLLFFMSGMMFGADRTEEASPEVSPVNPIEAKETETVQSVAIQTSTVQNNQSPADVEYKSASTHFTQKMASFIEGIVKGFYEIIVQLLYQVAQLFY